MTIYKDFGGCVFYSLPFSDDKSEKIGDIIIMRL